jgi:amidase
MLSSSAHRNLRGDLTVHHTRRSLLQAGLITSVAVAVNPWVPDAQADVPDFELAEKTIAQLQEGMNSGEHTARSLTEKYLARIEQIDKSGPRVNSVIEVNPDAVSIADELDKERKEKRPRGPLHGIPVLIKDNIATADRMMTTAGSLALLNSHPPKDSGVAQKLRQAGAVILGKTNLSEWANIRSSHSSSGWSGRGGQTKNPYCLDRNPCGSSSGSGAAASANLCAIAVGTETDGSVICPSSANGLVGIKPTLGLISRAGIIPIAHSQDTAGPMCRTVADAATLLTALAGEDPRDAVTKESHGKLPPDYTKFFDTNALKGARLGVARKYFGFSDDVDKLMNASIEELKKLGAVIVDPADLPTHGKFDDSEFEVLLFELKADLNAYLASLGPEAPVKSLKDVIDFNEKNKEQEMPWFGQDILIKAEGKGPLTTKAYVNALTKNHKLARTEGIDAIMNQHKLDAIIAPAGAPAWITDWINGDHSIGGSSNAAAVAGYPNITVPAGYVHGLPVGISFFGKAWSEPKLIGLAYSFEQATKVRKMPRFLATADLST